jgi:hypothetical protein
LLSTELFSIFVFIVDMYDTLLFRLYILIIRISNQKISYIIVFLDMRNL